MNLQNLRANILAIVAQVAPSVNTVKIGYISELNTGNTDYDVFLLSPPNTIEGETYNPDESRYEIKWWLIRQDKSETTGDFLNDSERIAAWDDIEIVNNAIKTAIRLNNNLFHIEGKVRNSRDSGGGDQYLTDRVIWIETSMTINTSNCGGDAVLPSPLQFEVSQNTEIANFFLSRFLYSLIILENISNNACSISGGTTIGVMNLFTNAVIQPHSILPIIIPNGGVVFTENKPLIIGSLAADPAPYWNNATIKVYSINLKLP